MFKVLGVYLFPIYVALGLLAWLSPDHSWELLLNVSWVLVLVLGLLWSIAQCTESDEEVAMAASPIDCPQCGVPNSGDRVLCEACLSDLYELDEQGKLVPLGHPHTVSTPPPLAKPSSGGAEKYGS